MSSSSPDVEARIGWLLAMSRLHHPDGSFRDGRMFAAALGRAGFPASRSLLSRWESGALAISYEGMTAYERVLALEPGQITSVTGYVKETLPGPRSHRVRPRLDPSSPEFARRLDELIDAAEDGSAGARTWQELGWHLTAAPMVHLRSRTWATLAGHLVGELPRAVKVAYRQLSTAAMDLASVPRAQDFLVDAIASYVSDPAVQVVDNPLSLLTRLPTRESARLVLEVMEKPQNDTTYQVGVRLATQKVLRGDLSPGERTQLHMLVLRLLPRDATRTGEDLAELVASLPEGVRAGLAQTAARAGRTLPVVSAHTEQLPAGKAGGYAEALAVAARRRTLQEPAYDEDRMLPRLVREALFHRDSVRRHCASLLVAASPFATGVAGELLGRLQSEVGPAWLRGREAVLVRYLCTDAHRSPLLALLDDPAHGVAIALTEALGTLSPVAASDRALRESLGETWSPRERAKLYALGMTASPRLGVLARTEKAPLWQRSAARWWLDQGAAIWF